MKSLELALGIYDDPEKKTKNNDEDLKKDLKKDYQYTVDLYKSNIAIFGSAMSGKTTLLKSILLRIHQVVDTPDKEEIYILDFNGNIGMYRDLPCVKACFDASNDENVRRIFQVIEAKLEKNVQILDGKTFIQAEGDETPKHVTFILDGLNNFYAESRYDMYHEILERLVRDGISKGISVLFTAYTPSGEINRLLSGFKCIVAFDMAVEHYSTLYSGKVVKPITLPGRGVVNIDQYVYEFQAYFPYEPKSYKNVEEAQKTEGEKQKAEGEEQKAEGEEQKAEGEEQKAEGEEQKTEGEEQKALEEFVEGFKVYHGEDTYNRLMQDHLKSFKVKLTVNEWETYTTKNIVEKDHAVIGLNYHTFERVAVNLKNARSIAIYGKRKWGKSNLLRLLVYGALNIGEDVRFVCLEDGRKGLDALEDIWNLADMSEYVNREEFVEYLVKEGYLNQDRTYQEADRRTDRPFTVFIIQSRLYYNSSKGMQDEILQETLSDLVDNADVENAVFIFSDVQRMMNYDARDYFNNGIRHAFLLDDIVRFVNDVKGQNSVFAHQDPLELKGIFGRCMVGDGFYFDLEEDTISKYKMIDVSQDKVTEENPCILGSKMLNVKEESETAETVGVGEDEAVSEKIICEADGEKVAGSTKASETEVDISRFV